jgi:CHAT domain-containing protein
MPDGPLLSIPFSLLVAGPREGQPLSAQPWLVRRFAIQHVPSAETLVTTRNAAGGAASTAPLAYAGFGDPVMPDRAQLRRAFPATACADDAELAGALPALPGSRVEVEAAAQLSGARPDAVRLGAAFTASALRAQRLEQYRVLHIATHALMSSELRCLREPSLMVSPPPGAPDASAAFVPASALLELKLDADLVILSACNTGTTPGGSALGGEGLSALARASFFAGARGVLATHWVLNDRAASRMVADLLERQGAEGQSSAAALRRAQLDLLDQAGNRLPEVWAHPYYWAPFALLGDGKRASRS